MIKRICDFCGLAAETEPYSRFETVRMGSDLLPVTLRMMVLPYKDDQGAQDLCFLCAEHAIRKACRQTLAQEPFPGPPEASPVVERTVVRALLPPAPCECPGRQGTPESCTRKRLLQRGLPNAIWRRARICDCSCHQAKEGPTL